MFAAWAGPTPARNMDRTVVWTLPETIRVLLIEDDERLASLTARNLEKHGLLVEVIHDGPAGLVAAGSGRWDVVLLDLMLPRLPGLDLCRQLRQHSDVPVIMVTALGDEGDKVLGLEVGADDYLAKPFSARELLARIRAQVRRHRGRLTPAGGVLRVGRLELRPSEFAASLDGRPLPLTTAEFNLLRAFAERPGRVLTRDQLLDLTKGSADEAFDRSIDAHISRLRHKLGDDPRSPSLLRTVRGAGYLLATEGEGDPT